MLFPAKWENACLQFVQASSDVIGNDKSPRKIASVFACHIQSCAALMRLYKQEESKAASEVGLRPYPKTGAYRKRMSGSDMELMRVLMAHVNLMAIPLESSEDFSPKAPLQDSKSSDDFSPKAQLQDSKSSDVFFRQRLHCRIRLKTAWRNRC